MQFVNLSGNMPFLEKAVIIADHHHKLLEMADITLNLSEI